MLEKIKTHFLKFAPRRFVVSAILLLASLDLINTYYLKLYWLNKDISTNLVYQMIQRNGYVLEAFSNEAIQEMKGFLDNTFYFFLFLILLNNLFFYFFYYKKKLWAQGYVLFYTLTAALFAVSFLIEKDGMGWGWFIYNILTTFVYLYLYLGVKSLKHETTEPKISPAHETTAQ